MIKTIDPKSISVPELHGILLSSIAPRPIAFASTIDKNGKVNLSPFSFFNVFSANPPILIFSPARRVRDNTTKDTLDNVHEVKEVCISVVNYEMVQQVSLSSTEYDKGVNEFVKAGFTEEASEKITPPRVKESPVSYECVVKDIQPMGSEGGAGNLVVCEVVLIHIDEAILDKNNKIDPHKIDSVARMGGDWYCRVDSNNIFEVAKPQQKKGIGIDKLPSEIKTSTILTGNNLAMLANVEAIPLLETIKSQFSHQELDILSGLAGEYRHRKAQEYLTAGEIDKAWLTLLL
ncbi:MAG: flavin reductase family protein [Bacteroidetes bacterium]|nr:MAG: flavin reductase family protein [Bacteroidota bacterium]